MNITPETLLTIAKNSRLKLTTEEVKEFTPQLAEILTHFEKLERLPTTTMSIHPHPVINEWREDTTRPSLSQEEALKNARFQSKGRIKGPPTLT